MNDLKAQYRQPTWNCLRNLSFTIYEQYELKNKGEHLPFRWSAISLSYLTEQNQIKYSQTQAIRYLLDIYCETILRLINLFQTFINIILDPFNPEKRLEELESWNKLFGKLILAIN